MTPSLAGPNRKIARAYEHIRNLEKIREQFLTAKPYRVVPEDDSETGDRVFRIRDINEQFGFWCAVVAGDAIHNLRSALDLLVWQLVLANGLHPTVNTAFPILRKAEHFKGTGYGKVKGCSKAAVRLIKSLKPYQRGNKPLWDLHRLDIADKHRLLLPVGLTFVGTRFQGWLGPNRPARLFVHAKRHTFSLRNGAILWRVRKAWRSNPNVDMNPEFAFEIAFGRIGASEGEPVVPTLNRLASAVEEAVDLFTAFFA